MDRCGITSQQVLNPLYSAITNAQPNELRRGAVKKTSLLEVRILRNYRQPIGLRVLPDCEVFGVSQTDISDMNTLRIDVSK
jgi:hypothetical protein